MLSLSILIIFDIFYYIQLKKQIKEDPKYNKIYYSKKKKTRKIIRSSVEIRITGVRKAFAISAKVMTV